MKAFILNVNILALFFVFAMGCTPNKEVVYVASPASPADTKSDDATSGGGIDSSGGDTGRSTPEEVKEAITLAMKWLTHEDPNMNVLARYARDWNYRHSFESSKFFESFTEKRKFDDYTDTGTLVFQSAVIDALKKKPPILLEEGPCPAKDKDHAAASVTSLSLDAELCLSIDQLSRTPKDALQTQVFGILVHEMAHMVGYEERAAMEYQNEFKDYIDYRMSASPAKDLNRHLTAFIVRAGIHFAFGTLAAKAGDRATAMTELIRLFEVVKTLPYFMDPMAMEIATKPKNLELFDNYSNAVLAILQKDVDVIYRTPLAQGEKGSSEKTAAELIQVFDENLKLVQIALMNLRAYHDPESDFLMDGKTDSPIVSRCILPAKSPSRWRELLLKADTTIWPSKECSPGTGP